MAASTFALRSCSFAIDIDLRAIGGSCVTHLLETNRCGISHQSGACRTVARHAHSFSVRFGGKKEVLAGTLATCVVLFVAVTKVMILSILFSLK
jgi:hypothetical protein